MDIQAVTTDRLEDLADLFNSNGATRGCWCMAFIVSNKAYQAGRYGGNREAFEAMAVSNDIPMGLIAYDDGTPVGWCAIGPRSRYQRAISPRATILAGRDPAEDDDVWFVPCFFVRVGHRRKGTTEALLREATKLAKRHGATAVEGFPLTNDQPQTDAYLGRESVFERCGFEQIARPKPRRAVMRFDV